SAKARLAAFLLDMIDRLRLADDAITDSFELRLTQEEIGDAVGLTSMGRASAKARLAAFLLDMIDRLRLADDNVTDSFDLRLTQEEIGDAVGLTSVHVNRMIRQLETEGLIGRQNGRITLLDESRLQEIGHYTNRHDDLDTEWLPAS
ncbi:MAG: helix-turn-helix domain-containing protein, partial [Sphingobium sp.]